MKRKTVVRKKQPEKIVSVENDWKESIKATLFETVLQFGIAAYCEMVEEEITALCGERYKHLCKREYTRWGKKGTSVVLGGRKVALQHSRVRDIQNNGEKAIAIVEQYKGKEALSHRQMEQMIIGVSARKYGRSLEMGQDAVESHAYSKSTVSRNFIAKTQEKVEAWRTAAITTEYPFLMIDGIVYATTTVLVALGIARDGTKKVLGAWEGSSENSRVCIDLLQHLVERGFDVTKCFLVIIDGSKALRKAIHDVFGDSILIQRCHVHKERNVIDYMPKGQRESVKRALSEAYSADTYDRAKRLLGNIHQWLAKDYPQAARSLEEGLEETLTLHKLGAHKKLRKSLGTTNPIESLNSGICTVTGRVKRWRNSTMVMRWVWSGIMESERNFRKINGHKYIDALLLNISMFGQKVIDENHKIA